MDDIDLEMKQELTRTFRPARTGRVRYLCALTFHAMLLILLMPVLLLTSSIYTDHPLLQFTLIGVAILSAATAIAGMIIVAIRRLHDANQSGWWILIYIVIWPALCVTFLHQFEELFPKLINLEIDIKVITSSVFFILPLFLLAIHPGDSGENDYGEPHPQMWNMYYIFGIVLIGVVSAAVFGIYRP